MKALKVLAVTLCTSLLFTAVPVCAEETAKGTRENPYTFTDEITLGQIYSSQGSIDVTIKLEEIMELSTVGELYPDKTEMVNQNHLVIKSKIITGDTSSAEDYIGADLHFKIFNADMSEFDTYLYNYSDGQTSLESFYSHYEYDQIMDCYTENSHDMDMKYIQVQYYASQESYNSSTLDSVWVFTPAYSTDTAEAPAEETTTETAVADNEISADFKQALDDYEAFWDEYIAFMETYDENDWTMLAKYASLAAKAVQLDASIAAMEDDEMTTAESAYYLEVTARVLQKMAASPAFS